MKLKTMVALVMVCAALVLIAALATGVSPSPSVFAASMFVAAVGCAASSSTEILGIDPTIEPALRALCAAKGWNVNDVLSQRAGSPEVRLKYARNEEGDTTTWLPSSRHLQYVAKGWTAIEMMESQ